MLAKMEPEAVVGRCFSGFFQNSSEYGTREKSLRPEKRRAVNPEFAQDLVRISASRRDGFEQSRRGGYRNHWSSRGLRPQPFLTLRIAAKIMDGGQVETDAVITRGG